ncbi:hypothetical protein Mlute_00476 [Meiothermus luteus]|uniref:Uncharacterized protein n=1 Tax=Meiothermus luteus TaxID=2026184 RepID=A0A399F2M8_9DEIN|nr:DUF815 domain-containing protein [Meiothermus luteus]RIH88871.1 hypothetical protein Mlute_00476 [Meiothermus luteus]RMH53870.1 MAG: DUF815 domain-containing protein [Deinococcota bacterium]
MRLFPPLHESPLAELFHAHPPRGEPWAWVLCQRLWYAEDLARRLLTEPLTPGLGDWIEQELSLLRHELAQLKQRYPFADFGLREASPAEQAALRVLQGGSASELQALYRAHGYGIYAQHTAFLYDRKMEPVPHPDPARFSDLVGYARQLQALRQHVEGFLEGKEAVPVLLYGARGSGKSTAVKALRTEYSPRGLRLVEVLPDSLEQLPALLALLAPLPYRFVLYLDDLAFSSDDERFHKLKALLEGAVYERPPNVLVVATSNRRNLVREQWSDRPDPNAPEPASWDTLQDKLALADRFGLVLTFPPFDQPLYLEAVAHILGRPLDEATRQAALRFALEGRGFSGRTARQFATIQGVKPGSALGQRRG